MDHIKHFVLFAMLCCSVSLSAQDNGEKDENPYKEIVKLQREANSKEKKIKELEEALKKMESQKAKVESLLKEERESGKSKEVRDRLNELQTKVASLEGELNKCQKDAQSNLQQQRDSYQQQISLLQQQQTEDSELIADLKRQVSELSGFRKIWLNQLAESVNAKWLEKPYSQISIPDLEVELKQYEEFAPSDKRIADAYNDLKLLLKDCALYSRGVQIINSPYDKDSINSILPSLKNLCGKTKDSARTKELSLLYWLLDNYGVTVEIFQDVIKSIDKQIDGQSSKKAALALVKATLDMQEKDQNISAIKKIPWLAEQYKEYYEDLQKDCLIKSDVHDRIMKIQP